MEEGGVLGTLGNNLGDFDIINYKILKDNTIYTASTNNSNDKVLSALCWVPREKMIIAGYHNGIHVYVHIYMCVLGVCNTYKYAKCIYFRMYMFIL